MTAGLPPLLAELAQVLGLRAALALAEAFGGQQIYVPRAPGKRHRIVKAIGAEAAALLARHYAGNRLDMPFAHAHSRAIRNAQMAKMAGQLGRAETAKRLGMHTRSVRRIVNRLPRQRDPRQGGLI